LEVILSRDRVDYKKQNIHHLPHKKTKKKLKRSKLRYFLANKTLQLKIPRLKKMALNVELPAAIVHNIRVYIKYLGILRADPEPNKLVSIAFDGLRNKYVVAALRARTFIHDATFLSPMRLFTHHNV
jgi:hypothetical protein